MNAEFERLWDKTNEPLVEMGIHEDSEYNKNMAKYYYLAGAAAMREKAADLPDKIAECLNYGQAKSLIISIADNIRKIEVN